MRALVLMSLMLAPALAAANTCEDLARAICPSKETMGDCVTFLDRELRTPEGKSLTGMTRLNACKAALGDALTLEDYKAGVRGKPRLTRPYTMQVVVEPQKLDGAAWDADGGPDVAVCLEVDGKAAGCLPEGADRAALTRAACPDAVECALRFEAQQGAKVRVEVVDVDEGGSEVVGSCAFTAGVGAVVCEGPVGLTTGKAAAVAP